MVPSRNCADVTSCGSDRYEIILLKTSLITRREETAAIRSQANTAKLLEDTPTLMRLRELEVLERIEQSWRVLP